MLKCFILILAATFSFHAEAQFAPTIHSKNNQKIGAGLSKIRDGLSNGPYKLENDKVVDKRNQIVGARKLDSFIATDKKQKVRFEVNQTVKFTCQRSWKSQKRSEAQIEAIRAIGAKHFVKVKGCDNLVDSSLISFVPVKLPQKLPSKATAIAQRSSQ